MQRFKLQGMLFEYDDEKNDINIEKHGISFEDAARVFFDDDRIEMFDDDNEEHEERFDTIGNIGHYTGNLEDVVFVVYTERYTENENGVSVDITRIISARMASNFEKGVYYGKYNG